MNNLLLIKMGGGVITDKNVRYGLREDVLRRIVGEIAEGIKGLKDTSVIVGNGAGSFAHYSAHKYRTAEGFVDKESRVGLGWVRYDAIKLNQIVFEQFLSANVPVFSYSPSSFMSVRGGEVVDNMTRSIECGMAQGLVPLVYGDAMVDSVRGSAIFSTERVFDELILTIGQKYTTRVIHINNEEGVLVDGKVVETINGNNFAEIEPHLGESGGVDVTGGMRQKVEACLKIAKKGAVSQIVSGQVAGRVQEAIAGKKVVGTMIC